MPKENSKLPILLIDLDDTLVGSSIGYDQAMIEIGIRPNDSTYLAARRQIKDQLHHGTASHSRNLYFKRYLELKGTYSAQAHLELVTNYEEALSRNLKSQWLSLERAKLFDQIKSLTSEIVLVTNETLRAQTLKLMAIDPLGTYFNQMLTSEEAGVEKPDLKIFNLALSLLKRSEIVSEQRNVFMVGDSFKNDIEPCFKLGFTPVLTTEFLPPLDRNKLSAEIARNPQLNIQILSDLNNLPEILIESSR